MGIKNEAITERKKRLEKVKAEIENLEVVRYEADHVLNETLSSIDEATEILEDIGTIKNSLSKGETRPYENEHSCRLEDPDKYDRFARKNCEQKHEGKCIDVIYGIKEGKSEIQALRYNKEIWTKEAARNHCKEHDGSFEAAKEEDSMERKVEIRTYPIELRVESEDDKPKIKGHAAVFNKWSADLGGGLFPSFKEKILPGAFKNALTKSDIRMLWNHNADIVLGRQSAGTLSVEEDSKGLYVEDTPPSWAENYIETIKRGDVSEMSFAFIVAEGGDEFDEDKHTRTISEIEQLFDVSPCTYPAYPQTSVKVRMAECDIESIRNTVSMEIKRYLHQPEQLDGQGEPPQKGHIGRLVIKKKRLDLIEKE